MKTLLKSQGKARFQLIGEENKVRAMTLGLALPMKSSRTDM